MKGITVDMTGIVFFLLLTGVVFMVGSFFITERLSPSELNKITELSKDELGRIIDGALADAKSKVEESIEAQIDASSEQVERALEKETNEKIMAISEYSDTVMENMNKTHNEIMFLYKVQVQDLPLRVLPQVPLQSQHSAFPFYAFRGSCLYGFPPFQVLLPFLRPGLPALLSPLFLLPAPALAQVLAPLLFSLPFLPVCS